MSETPGAASLRLMHVHAHPDDESSKGAASTAKYVAEGVEVMVVTCTGGERGSVLNPKMNRPEVWSDLTAVRAAEMDAARQILGVDQRWLGHHDSGLPEGDPLPALPVGSFATLTPEVAAEPLVALIREFQPQVVTTYDEFGGYPHPDHIQCHRVTIAAVRMAAQQGVLTEAGEPWQVSKVYYQMTLNRPRMLALDAAMREAGLGSPYADWLEGPANFALEPRITTRVECAEYFEVRDRALKAHATQVDPDGFWFAVPREIQQRVWPTEDFILAASTIPVSLPEDDLFAGLR